MYTFCVQIVHKNSPPYFCKGKSSDIKTTILFICTTIYIDAYKKTIVNNNNNNYNHNIIILSAFSRHTCILKMRYNIGLKI